MQRSKVVAILGGAGLVGQNLILQLKKAGYENLLVVDKHVRNLSILSAAHPDVKTFNADLSQPGEWQAALADCSCVVMLQAQIGGESRDAFERNNIQSTRMVLEACRNHHLDHLVHISSSVINSMARDWYVETKTAQEQLVVESGIPYVVLRPTLMFGWFDRKHLGWLSRFMARVPVFPVPGSGRYLRQPLYVMDFCSIILACLQRQPDNKTYDISGREKLTYIDLIMKIKKITSSPARILNIPYWLFWALLKLYALFDRDPPFTTRQLEALVVPEEFPVIPWWDIFGVTATPIDRALQEVFGPSPYKDTVLEF